MPVRELPGRLNVSPLKLPLQAVGTRPQMVCAIPSLPELPLSPRQASVSGYELSVISSNYDKIEFYLRRQ